MDITLVDKIVEGLSDYPEAQSIVEEFRKDWQTQIEDAFLAGQHQWCDDHRCINPEEYLNKHFDIEL